MGIPTVYELDRKLAIIDERTKNNTSCITNLEEITKELATDVWKLKIKLVAYSASGAGIGSMIVTGIFKLIEHAAK